MSGSNVYITYISKGDCGTQGVLLVLGAEPVIG